MNSPFTFHLYTNKDNVKFEFALKFAIVVEDLPRPIVLGLPFMDEYDMWIMVRSRQLICREHIFPGKYHPKKTKQPLTEVRACSSLHSSNPPINVYTKENITLLPGESMMVPIFIHNIPKLRKQEILIFDPSPVYSLDTSPLLSIDSIISTSSPEIILVNMTSQVQLLQAFTNVGTVDYYTRSVVSVKKIPDVTFPQVDTVNDPLLMTVTSPQGHTTSKGEPLPPISTNLPSNIASSYSALALEFEDIFHYDFSKGSWDTDQVFRIDLKPGAVPFADRPYRMCQTHQDALRKLLDKYIREGIIEKSNSPWAAPCFFVPKPNNGLRFVVDFRQLNSQTISLHWPLPLAEDIIQKLHGASVFSSFDAHSGFTQQPIHVDSRPMTGFVTCFGQYQYMRLPMGVKNGPSSYSRAMSEMVSDIGNLVNFIDDILIYNGKPSLSQDEIHEEHLVSLRKFFQRCRDKNLKLNGAKSIIGAPSVKYLGHVFDSKGVRPDSSKLDAVRSFKTPTNVTAVKSFLGLVNFYRSWIRDCASLQLPLNELLLKDKPFVWTNECEDAFNSLKKSLTVDCVLSYPDPNSPFNLYCDCSDFALGGISSQVDPMTGHEKVVGYHSRSLSAAERNYNVHEKECLAILDTIKKFHTYCQSGPFIVYTDHRSLASILSWKNPTRRIARWLSTLSEYDFTAVYKKGSTHHNADALSRLQSDNVIQYPSEAEKGKVICRDGVWATEGIYDGSMSEYYTIYPGAKACPITIRTDKNNNTDVSDKQILQASNNIEDYFHLLGKKFKDNNRIYRISDIWFDQLRQGIYCSRISDDGDVPTDSALDIFPIEYILEKFDMTTIRSKIDYNNPPSLRESTFQKDVEEELKTLYKEKVLTIEDVDLIPDENNNYHYYRKVWDEGSRTEILQLLIPSSNDYAPLRNILLKTAHDQSGHFGISKCFANLKSRVFWRHIRRDLIEYIKSCDICARKGNTRDTVNRMNHPINRHPPVVRPFQRLSVDIMGPFPLSISKNKYVLTMVDHFSKWLEIDAIEEADAKTVANSIISHIYLRHGSVQVLLADNGNNITAGNVNAHLFSSLGSYLTRTTAYHPESNGQVERLNGVIKNILAKFCSDATHKDWDCYLSYGAHAYNTSVHVTTGFTPFFLVHGRECRRPIDDYIPTFPKTVLQNKTSFEYISSIQQRLEFANMITRCNLDQAHSLYNSPAVAKRSIISMQKNTFNIRDTVLVYWPNVIKVGNAKKLTKFYHGPFTINDIISPVIYSVTDNTTSQLVHIPFPSNTLLGAYQKNIRS